MGYFVCDIFECLFVFLISIFLLLNFFSLRMQLSFLKATQECPVLFISISSFYNLAEVYALCNLFYFLIFYLDSGVFFNIGHVFWLFCCTQIGGLIFSLYASLLWYILYSIIILMQKHAVG